MRRDMRPALNQFADYEICYGNAFHINKMSGYNIKSSGFTISSVNGTVYMSDIPNSDGKTGSGILFGMSIIAYASKGDLNLLEAKSSSSCIDCSKSLICF